MRTILPFLFLLIACDRKNDDANKPAPSASQSAAPTASVVVDAGPAKNDWSGNYTAKPASIFVPDGGEWSGVKFRGEDAGEGLGDGTLTITIAPDGIVSGVGDGALGAFTIAGTSTGNDLTFVVRRKDPTDMSFTGTGQAKIDQGKLEGSMRVSKATANVIREATFSLHR